jgi:hypothetical protein
MAARRTLTFYRTASALALVLVLAGCTKGGAFDPTEIFNSDVFDSKKKIKGDREPLFPDGVPGTTTGVPPDLVKGYQAPPDADAAATPPPEPAKPEAKAEVKPKPKPKPKLAAAPAKPPAATRINIGSGGQAMPSQAPWSAASSAPPAAPAAPSAPWPTPPQQTAQPSQSVWPATPGGVRTTQ